VEAAGGVVPCGEGVEVSPLVSYAGEGLEELCAGRTFASAYDVTLQAGTRGPRAACTPPCTLAAPATRRPAGRQHGSQHSRRCPLCAHPSNLQGVVQLAPKPNAAGRLLRGAAGGSAEYNSPRPAPKAAAPAGATIVANCSAFRSQQ
jgi:hypothetical protein